MDGQNWTEDKKGLHLGKFEKRRQTFFQIYGRLVYGFVNERLLVCQVDVWTSLLAKLNKIT